MREVDPTPRTSHVTPPFLGIEYPGGSHMPPGACQVQRTAQCAWLRVRRETGVWHKAMPPPTPIPGEQLTCPGGASPPPPGLPLMSLWGPGGVTPVPFPSGGPDRLPASSLFLILERSLQWSTGPPGFGYRDCATRRETHVRLTPLPWALTLFPVTHPALVPLGAVLHHTVKLGPGPCFTIPVDA